MVFDIGPQYEKDDHFKVIARLHQSKYRAENLQVDYDEYGNRLTEPDARALLNYYPKLNIRAALRKRYPSYSKMRDADMLRSEHIPFNLFAPLRENKVLAIDLVRKAFSVSCKSVEQVLFEYAPQPKEFYLNDRTAFDVYIKYIDEYESISGIGVEVKYSETEYPIGITERKRVENEQSTYWQVTRASGQFIDPSNIVLAADSLRQIWRNHLLGLAMIQQGDLHQFFSITLYPTGNTHFEKVIPQYKATLNEKYRPYVRGCTYEKFIDLINGDEDILHWKKYLVDRYLVDLI